MKKVKFVKDSPQFLALRNGKMVVEEYRAGDVAEFEENQAEALINAGLAVPIEEGGDNMEVEVREAKTDKKESGSGRYNRIFNVYHETRDGYRSWADISVRKEDDAVYLTVGSGNVRASVRLYPDEIAVLYVKLGKLLNQLEW